MTDKLPPVVAWVDGKPMRRAQLERAPIATGAQFVLAGARIVAMGVQRGRDGGAVAFREARIRRNSPDSAPNSPEFAEFAVPPLARRCGLRYD